MSDTYNRYYHEHFTVHINNRNINYVLQENCPYCKRSRRWLYYNNLRERAHRVEPHLEGILRITRLNRIVNDYNQVRDINSRIDYITPNVPNILTYEALSQLPSVEVKTTLEEINKNSTIDVKLTDEPVLCVICQENIKKYEIIRKIKCRHYFHIECIDTWLTNNKTCPTCKYKF
tara:strand:- start:2786 stop:3310 length:525 start_codon:yes stop_codon:yes gene_type:complete